MEQKDFYNGEMTLKEFIKYGVLYPIGLIIACGIAELLESI